MEEIILCKDPIASSLLKHFYSTLKERESLDALLPHEIDFKNKIEEAYLNHEQFNQLQVEGLLGEVYSILDNKERWNETNNKFYSALEKIVFTQKDNKLLTEHFDKIEEVISSVMNLDYSNKAPITNVTEDQRNILNYVSIALNMLIEKFQSSVVSNKVINALIATMPDTGFFVTDKEGKIRFSNRILENILSIENELVLDENIADFVLEYDEVKKDFILDNCINNKSVTLVNEQGKRVPMFLTIPKMATSRDEIDEMLFIFTKDETSNEERVFDITMDSHDRIAPVNQIIGAANYLKETLEDKDARFFAELIYNNAQLVKEQAQGTLISLSQGYSEGFESIDFNTQIESVTKLFKTGRVNFKVDVSTAQEFFSVRRLINSLILNLVSNSIKYGKLGEQNEVSIVVKDWDDKGIELTISDTGIGISPEAQKLVFNKDYRASKQAEGNGKGLFLVKGIVEKLQGNITLISSLGIGSSFTIQLPHFSMEEKKQ